MQVDALKHACLGVLGSNATSASAKAILPSCTLPFNPRGSKDLYRFSAVFAWKLETSLPMLT